MPKQRSYCPSLEGLEDRLVPYTVTPYSWSNLNLSASFMPDGTSLGAASNDLFSTYDSAYDRATWQRQFARALQTWASVTPLNFHFVADNGAASGADGLCQGDAGFGDIRLSAHPFNGDVLAYSYNPFPGLTMGGDIFLNSSTVSSTSDLYAILLHEAGHALGLNHSSDADAVMGPFLQTSLPGLGADDIAGIQAKYGRREHDSFDATSGNDSLTSATPLLVDQCGKINIAADLTTLADIDYYALTVPQDLSGTLTVTMEVSNISLLVPRLAILNRDGQVVALAHGGSAYGTSVTATFTGLNPGDTYYVVADGQSADVFGMGAYVLNAQFGASAAADASVGDPGEIGADTVADNPEPPAVASCVSLAADPCNPGKQVILVQGTSTNDSVVVSATVSRVQVSLNGQTSSFNRAGVFRVMILGREGADSILLQSTLTLSAFVDGGAGNDVIRSGSGHDVLLGGAGDDWIVAGLGRDVIIGGVGTDRLRADGGDLVVGGATIYDMNPEALGAIWNCWKSAATYQNRILAIRSGAGVPRLSAAEIFDVEPDTFVSGIVGQWYLRDTSDTFVSRKATEAVTTLNSKLPIRKLPRLPRPSLDATGAYGDYHAP